MRAEILKKIICICLYLTLIAPFLIWGKFVFPYITPKTLFFRIIIEIALFFYILLIIYRPEYRPRFSKLTWAILIYLFIITFASIFGLDPYRSFWGNIERSEGLLTIYHLFIFFILITALFREKKDWFKFFNISIFVSLLVAFYALGQKIGVSFLLPSAGGARLTGTIGNASFLAAYLLMNIFLCLFLLVNKQERPWRIFYGLAFLFEAYILFETGTRGAALAFFGGLLVLAVLSAIFSKNKKIKLGFVGLFLLLIILGVSIWICRDQAWVRSNYTLDRLVSISPTDITTQSRLLGWRASWQGWLDRFFLGYGYENYNIAFNKYFPVLIYRDVGSQVWFDRAHNIIFDQAVPGGIFGLLAYLSILGLSFWVLWSKLMSWRKKREDSQENQSAVSYNQFGFIALIALLAAYFVQNFFVFDTLGTYILFYSVLGFLSYLSISRLPNKGAANQDKKGQSQSKPDSQPRPFFIIILALLFIWAIYIFNLKPALANTLSIKGMSYAYSDMYRQAISEFRKSLSYGTNQAPEIRHNLSRTVVKAFQSKQFSQQENIDNFKFAVEEMEKNFQMAPFNARHYAFAMSLYNAVAILNHDYYDKVIELGEHALSLSPTRPQLYYAMGQARISQKRYEEGLEYFRKAVELNPAVIESHWNLAAAYIIAGQDKLAEQEFRQMIELGFKYYSMANLQRLVRPYLIREDFYKLALVYQEMIKLEPNNPDFYAKLAASYKEIGQIDRAKQAVQKAVELDPDFADEAALFLEMLE